MRMQVDFINNNDHPENQRPTNERWCFVVSIGIGLATSALVIGLIIGSTMYSIQHEGILPYSIRIIAPYLSSIPIVNKLISQQQTTLKGEEADRVNMLILGMGGEDHDGANLTDTVLLASFRPSTHTLGLLSIPRDVVVPTGGAYWKKVNSINANAEVTNPGLGGEITRSSIEKILQTPIPYYVRVDFSGFTDVVDAIGGIMVNADRTFDDYRYPILGKENAEPYESRFTHIHFDTGEQWMDGQRTLTFVRSRHGTNGEGSDFARAKRQQRVLEAIRKKIGSSAFLLNPRQTIRLLTLLQQHVKTNVQLNDLARIKELIENNEHITLVTKVLDPTSGIVLESKGIDGAFILLPRDQSFGEIRNVVRSLFTVPIPSTTPTARVAIQNATFIAGLARVTSKTVEQLGYRVTMVGNAPHRLTELKQNIIYDFTNGKKLSDLKQLQEKLHAVAAPASALGEESALSIKELFGTIAYASDNSTFDFLVVIGSPPQNDSPTSTAQ